MATTKINNDSQTLFRFVSIRNPQLTETKKDNLGFIHYPNDVKSYFEDKINPNDTALSKFQSLQRLSKEFNSTGYQNELELERGNLAEVLKLGRKIAKKERLSGEDEITAKTLYTNPNIQNMVGEIWDNLIYQTVTENNFYAKEGLVQILKALHFGYVCDLAITPELVKINGEDLKAKALEARIVLPMKFLGDGYEGEQPSVKSGNAFQVNISKISEGVINGSGLSTSVQEQLKAEGKRINELSGLYFEKNSLSKLKTELENIQSSYIKAKNKAYEKAHQEYLQENGQKINEYNSKLAEIKSQIKEGMTREEIENLYAGLKELDIPTFDFTYKNELNFEDFKTKLPLDSLKLFVAIFTQLESGEMPAEGFDFSSPVVISDRKLQLGRVTVVIAEEYDKYAEVFDQLDKERSSNTKELFSKSPLQEEIYLSLGNILIPVMAPGKYSQINSRTYYLAANYNPLHSRTPASFTFYYQAESNSWGLGTAKVTATTDIGNYEEIFSNISIVDNKITLPPFLVEKFGKTIKYLRVQIYFNNGQEATVEYSDLVINQPYTGILYTETSNEDSQEPEDGNSAPKPGTFFPKHFGIKRLGIADYLKVVQSTHAYVPGEVTHIENIMAKEFKQKSTRRLRRSEIQTTTSKSTEREALSDTTTTTRNDMQTETANVIQQAISTEAHFRYGGMGKPFEVGGSFASNNAKENSIRQAVAKSQEITEKATERILTKVSEERIEKILEEFEENNAHGFDNRDGDKHVVGVYRWIDKKMKNQIYNYGKRTMFEFMIPEPAKLHRLATAASVTETLKAPIDPRKAPEPWTIVNPKAASMDQLQYWAGIYNVKLTELPEATKKISSGLQWIKLNGDNGYKHFTIDIPDNYQASHVKMWYGFERNRGGTSTLQTSDFSGGMFPFSTNKKSIDGIAEFTPQNVTGSYNFVYQGSNIDSVNFTFEIDCKLSDAFMNVWKQENFDAIIKAYEEAYVAFLEKQKELEEKAKEKEAENKEKVSNFYRDMERVILKHNCIAFLLQDYSALGKNLTTGNTMQDFSIILDNNLEQYTALAKFMEQAFEWSIMDYTFYPYYWANREEWQKMYLTESADPLFRNFLQAGMARVIVTVNPGFEDAVQFFLTTGRIWNGGEVPVIGDPMYMSIVDEMREPIGVKQGKAWVTTLPTSLTILQEGSAGLETLTALPFSEENPEEFEVPSDVITGDIYFKKNNNLLGVQQPGTSSDKIISGEWQ